MVERFLAILLALAAIGAFAGAILIDSGSAGQGGRYYVPVGALVALGALDSQFQRLLKRRLPFSFGTSGQERRYALVILLALIAAGAVLIGVAWMLA
jgi:uncharacterized membrane protein YebE (DUF533 family)